MGADREDHLLLKTDTIRVNGVLVARGELWVVEMHGTAVIIESMGGEEDADGIMRAAWNIHGRGSELDYGDIVPMLRSTSATSDIDLVAVSRVIAARGGRR